MKCKEDKDGAISCELPDQEISYRVEELSTSKEVIDHHMYAAFGGAAIYDLLDEFNKNKTQKKEIVKGLKNYVKMVSEHVQESSDTNTFTYVFQN